MRILVECFADNLFMEKLGYVIDPDHSSISNVARRMKENYEAQRVLGIVDNDSESIPTYFHQFVIIDETHSVLFLKHQSQDRYLIKINKDFEEFILRIETEAKVKPFRKTKSLLQDITKKGTVVQHKPFNKHLDMLIDKNPASIAFLKKCIERAKKARLNLPSNNSLTFLIFAIQSVDCRPSTVDN